MYIDDGRNASLDAIGASMARFAGAAAGLAGQELGLDKNLAGLAFLPQEQASGSSNNAKAMKPHVASVASDEQGFLTRLKALGDNLTTAREAIQTAMQNHRETDSDIADGLA